MGFFDKIRNGLKKTKENIGETFDSVLAVFRQVDEELLEELEDALILADIGAQTASETIEELRSLAKRQNIETKEQLTEALCQILAGKDLAKRFGKLLFGFNVLPLGQTAQLLNGFRRRLSADIRQNQGVFQLLQQLFVHLAENRQYRIKGLADVFLCLFQPIAYFIKKTHISFAPTVVRPPGAGLDFLFRLVQLQLEQFGHALLLHSRAV